MRCEGERRGGGRGRRRANGEAFASFAVFEVEDGRQCSYLCCYLCRALPSCYHLFQKSSFLFYFKIMLNFYHSRTNMGHGTAIHGNIQDYACWSCSRT
ncbi:hypothetical protein S83_042373 [Arachis hypogaea]